MDAKFKTTLVIWSDFDPATRELADLAREATDGAAICTSMKSVRVEAPAGDPEFAGASEFFRDPDDDRTEEDSVLP